MADKIKHPKKKRRPVKKPPAISVFDTVVTREQWESWLKNQLRRESVILRMASVKTAATKDELENLMRKDAFLIAAAKALGVWEPEHEEWLRREGYEQYFVPPQKKASDVKIWDEKNTPPKNPINKDHSIFVWVRNQSNAVYVAYFDFVDEVWRNRENKMCRDIVDFSITKPEEKETEE